VTLAAACSAPIFYHATSGTKNYSTPGGFATDCLSPFPTDTYGSGTGSGSVPNTVFIHIS
jgi:hypothetical protein